MSWSTSVIPLNLTTDQVQAFIEGARTPRSDRAPSPPPPRGGAPASPPSARRGSRPPASNPTSPAAPSAVRVLGGAAAAAVTPPRERAQPPSAKSMGIASILTPRKEAASKASAKPAPSKAAVASAKKRPAADADSSSALVAMSPPPSPAGESSLKRRRIVAKMQVEKPLTKPVPNSSTPFNASAMAAVRVMSPSSAGHRYPQRCRIRTLEHWRNEKKILVRREGDAAPSIAAVELNLAPRPWNTPTRSLGGSTEEDIVRTRVLQVPRLSTPSPAKPAEFSGLKFSAFESKVISLATKGRYLLPVGAVGFAHVLEGTARLGCEDGAELTLKEGTFAALPLKEVPNDTDLILGCSSSCSLTRVKLILKTGELKAANAGQLTLALEDK
mmetsp:Transcript_64536/g.154162  ORF Transcript_64536/g.154162 Transcript_64536/m.154162 type:complete len:386 (-) Transcript_64536:68-1225(-)|eukprot:CAMPEP_0178410198 /NCGR_PEP_ID=MMETSP0689_2-20121128/20855_1 /TAXON_ID=160604 /ORGANISM="Amphidinium massartii, Strain CS-259" /LENGTH=385 /DNA_ID=CAMNT_0020031365 /DNA_START=102 /DNA_END=1259 /DNA_ORIENTATION=-